MSENPGLLKKSNDPVIIATGYKKNRFYLFTSREPDVRYIYTFYILVNNQSEIKTNDSYTIVCSIMI